MIRRYFPALLLTVTAGILSFGMSSYGGRIAAAPSTRAAAPYAAPFALLVSGTAASYVLAVASLCSVPLRKKA